MVLEQGWALEAVLPFVTSNPASVLKLPSKEGIRVGGDADLLLLEVRAAAAFREGCVAWLLLAFACSRLPPQPQPILRCQELPPPAQPHLQPATLELRYVIARGQVVKTPEWVRGGMFERGEGIRPRPPAVNSWGGPLAGPAGHASPRSATSRCSPR